MRAEPGVVTGSVLVLLRLEGLAELVAATVAYHWLGHSWWLYAALFFAPDLSMLGYLAGPKVGAVAYNLLHTSTVSLLLLLGGYVGGVQVLAAVALIWIAHIGFDRLLGFGLKYPEAFQQTHLGSGRK